MNVIQLWMLVPLMAAPYPHGQASGIVYASEKECRQSIPNMPQAHFDCIRAFIDPGVWAALKK